MTAKRESNSTEWAGKESVDAGGSENLEERVSALEKALSQAPGGVTTGSRSSRRLWLLAALAALVLIAPQLWLWRAFDQVRKERTKEQSFWLLCHGKATPDERARAFLELVRSGNTEWRSARLSHLQLGGVDLQGASLAWANLDGSTLTGANLAGAVLTGCTFRNAKLAHADFSQAQLRGADFGGAGLENCDLRNADLRGAFMGGATMTGCNLTAADLSSADLRRAELSGANLSGAILRASNLELANLIGSDLSKVDLRDANWWRARGLTPEVVAEYRSRFPPSGQTDPKLQEDYKRWLAQLESVGRQPGSKGK